MTPVQQQIVLVNWTNETQLFLLYFSALFDMNINMQKASMSCGPLTSETDSVAIKKKKINKIMAKNVSNAQEVNIFSSSNVNFYTILSPVLDSDSEILKMMKMIYE